MLEYIVENFLIIYLLELFAAITGTYYLKQISSSPRELRIFVYYLWLMVFVELLGFYTVYAYFVESDFSRFIENTPFSRNFWLYNSLSVVTYFVFFQYFIVQLNSRFLRKISWTVVYIYLITAILNLFVSGIFFEAYSAYTSITGTLMLVILIMFYYYELLRSHRILDFYKDLPFYISVGALIWHLCVTPLFIYSKYFSLQSPDFVLLHSRVLSLANFILYGTMILGFLICSRRERKAQIQLE